MFLRSNTNVTSFCALYKVVAFRPVRGAIDIRETLLHRRQLIDRSYSHVRYFTMNDTIV